MSRCKFCSLILFFTAVNCQYGETSFRIGAFNIQVFGKSKMEKPAVVQVLIDSHNEELAITCHGTGPRPDSVRSRTNFIIRRYDIILIQEIKDAQNKWIHELLEQVNARGPHRYDISISERLGSSIQKEQYAFLYRSSSDAGITVEQIHQYPAQVFERPPYSVLISSQNTEISEFALMAIHTKPTNAVNETNELASAHNQLSRLWNTENILILGDFNADCSYISNAKKDSLVLRIDPKYKWWIGDDVDTTVADTDCAYDRFVMTGNEFIDAVVPGSAKRFRFDTEYGLDQVSANTVSDHYPIELQLYTTDAISGTTKLYDIDTDGRVSIFTIVPIVVKAYLHFLSCL